jgi:hypothetical protein
MAMTWSKVFLILSLVAGLVGFLPHQAVLAAPADLTWVPSWVRLETGDLGTGQRYVLNRMMWRDTSGLAADNATYEQDFAVLLSDDSPGTYFARDQDFQDIPLVASWKSDLPDPYLDTRFNDSPETWVYTIGSADADTIEPNRVYFTLIVTEPGDAVTDVASLSAQLGEYRITGPTGVPVPCGAPLVPDTWCSWALDAYAFAPAWSIAVPGTVEFDLTDEAVTEPG